MVILGLTGSIGMGKTMAAMAFRMFGVAVYDADKVVHALMVPGGAAVAAVMDAFPDVAKNGAIDRQALGGEVFADDRRLQQLENILHPLARQKQAAFLAAAARRGERLVVLDIPLLLETGGETCCDGVVVVSAPATIQKQRVLSRPGMTAKRLNAILEHQLADQNKRWLADFIVETGLSRRHSLRQIANIVRITKGWRARAWSPANNSKRDIRF